MKITESQLRILIKEMLLQERSTLPAGVDLYHRSRHNFKVGDIVDGSHSSRFRDISTVEKVIEIGRVNIINSEWKRENPSFYKTIKRKRTLITPEPPAVDPNQKPLSRLNCVYASLIPRSRFMNYGKLYRVKLLDDNYQITNSMEIDRLHDMISRKAHDYDYQMFKENEAAITEDLARWFRSDIERYFQEPKINKLNLQDIEVYARKMQVVEAIDEKDKILTGDSFVSSEPITVMAHFYVDENTKSKLAQMFSDIGVEIESQDWKGYKVVIPANKKFTLSSINKRIADKTKKPSSYDYDDNKYPVKDMKISFEEYPKIYLSVSGGATDRGANKIYKDIRSGKIKKVM